MSLRILCGSLSLAALSLVACQDAGPTASATTRTVSAAAAHVQLPFEGRSAGTTVFSPSAACTSSGPNYLATVHGTGVATHVGGFVVNIPFCAKLVLPSMDHVYGPGPGLGKLTAANGDEVWFTTDSGGFTAATGRLWSQHTIAGGSGRFTGATGSFSELGLGGAQGWTNEISGWINY